MEARVENGGHTLADTTISVIVVLFNSSEYIGECLESLAATGYPDLEVILADNGSDDDSLCKAREVAQKRGLRTLASDLGRNRGFASANDEAFALSSGEIILLLNPDTELYPAALTALVAAFDADDSIGIAGCKLYYPDRKTIQHAGGFVRDNGLTMHYGADEPDEGQCDEMRDVQYVTGAALAIRRDVFVEAGMLDPGYYPAYFEETDLCLSVRRLGYRVVYVPDARLIHHESTTTTKYSERFLYLYHRNRIRYLLKNYSWRFLLDRALPFEQRWLGWIPPEEKAGPLKKAYLVNFALLPRTMMSRWRRERSLSAPRIEDTTGEACIVVPED
jgi:O-antigen biosynthesis protein